MLFKDNKRFTAKILPLLVVLILVVSLGGGCVRQMAKGWSGGAVTDGTLYMGSMDGELLAINATNGTFIWQVPLETEKKGGACSAPPTPPAIYGTPAISQGLVFIGSYNGKIYAYNTATGALRWVYPRMGELDTPVIGGPLVAGETLYIAGADGKVYALDAQTGDIKWEFQTGDKIWNSPAVKDNTLFIGSFDHKIYAIETTNGSQKWEFETSGAVTTQALVHMDTVYIGAFDRHLYALDVTNGNLKWKFMGQSGFWTQPLASDNTIYAPCLDGKVYVLDAQSGGVKDAIDLGSPISSSPVLVEELLIVATQDGKVYAIDRASNQQRWLVNLREMANRTKLTINAPLTESDGSIFIHTQGYEAIYAMNTETGVQLWSPIVLE